MSDYEIGYGKTPVATRFKPGENRNPKGRGAKRPWSASKDLDGVINAAVVVTEGGKKKVINMMERMLRQWAKEAAQGSLKHAEMLLNAHAYSKRHGDFHHEPIPVEEHQLPGNNKITAGMTAKQASEVYWRTMKEVENE